MLFSTEYCTAAPSKGSSFLMFLGRNCQEDPLKAKLSNRIKAWGICSSMKGGGAMIGAGGTSSETDEQACPYGRHES